MSNKPNNEFLLHSNVKRKNEHFSCLIFPARKALLFTKLMDDFIESVVDYPELYFYPELANYWRLHGNKLQIRVKLSSILENNFNQYLKIQSIFLLGFFSLFQILVGNPTI